MSDEAINAGLRNGDTVHELSDETSFLYTLDFGCPFPWPQVPNYPISSDATATKVGSSSDISNGMATVEDGVADDTDALAATSSRMRADSMQEGDRLPVDSNHEAGGMENAIVPEERLPYPDTLQEYYWNCLYGSSRNSKNEASARLLKAFKSERYKTTSLHTDGTHARHQSYRDTLSSILYTKLGKLDKKYHVDLPMIIDDWTRAHQYFENGTLAEEAGDIASEQDGISRDAISSAETIDSVKSGYKTEELAIFRKTWEEWMQSARGTEEGETLSDSDRRNRLKSTIRERLGILETIELQLQILVALELLCVLPIPSYLTSRSAHHRRLQSTSAHPQNWLAILRAGTPQRGSNGGRKRKKDSFVGTEQSSLPINGPVTSSNLTTPRQSTSSFGHQSTHSHHIETIAEDEQDETTVQRQRLERLFKETARLLDTQTDNLAIQQTVANAIGGLSLADLMGDSIHGETKDGKGKGKEKEELDGFQLFWLDVVEEHYSSRLPSDILSGCHSKFFSNSLDPSLANSLHTTSAISASHPHPSPFHHPTPDLRQLARSVHLANLQAEKNAIPQSPTLVKLLAAKEEIDDLRGRRPALIDGHDDELGDILNGKEDVDWLMPAPAPATLAEGNRGRRSGASVALNDRISIKRNIKRLGGSPARNKLPSSTLTTTANINNNLKHHHTRIVEFGKIKEIKDKREEIQKKMSSSSSSSTMRQSSLNGASFLSSKPTSISSSSSTLKPSNSSSARDVHPQAQSLLESGKVSLMGRSLGAKGMKNNPGTLAINNAIDSGGVRRDGETAHIARIDDSTRSSLSSKTLYNASINGAGRISKRKAASPRKTSLPDARGSSSDMNDKRRTLVLATPVKLRTKVSVSSSALFGDMRTRNGTGYENGETSSFRQKQKDKQEHQDSTSSSRRLGKSTSLPAFKWGLPEFGKGIDEGDEEDMDRGFGMGGSGGDSDDDEEERGGGEGEEIVHPSKGMLLVGETPQKG